MSIQVWPWEGSDRSTERDAVLARKDQLVDRLNRVVGPGLGFRWDAAGLTGNKAQLRCNPAFSPATRFQKFMKEYVERPDQVIPIRFVPGDDPDPADPQNKRLVCEDAFFTAAVDLDDLMIADDIGFQAILMHFLEERYSNRDYVNDVLNNPPPADARTDQNYVDRHTAARVKEAALFQGIFRDTTIRTPPLSFSPRTNVPYVIVYPSNGSYSIVERIERPWDPVARMDVWVVEGTAQSGTTIRAAEYAARRAGYPPVPL